jgi:hypothetical protein
MIVKLFNNNVSTADVVGQLYSVKCDRNVIIDGEEVRIWKESIVVSFKAVLRHAAGVIEIPAKKWQDIR